MSRRGMTRTIVTVVAACSAAAALVAVVLFVVIGRGGFTPAAIPLGWFMPVCAAVIAGSVTWLLMGETPKREGQDRGRRSPEVACPTCGGEVVAGWRLCPWCGSRLTQAEAEQSV